MKTLKVTYTDGSSYITDANATPAEFKAYLTQFGPTLCAHEDPETGTETFKTVATVEEVTDEDNDKDARILELTNHLRRVTRAIENMTESIKSGEFTITTQDGEPANIAHAEHAAREARAYYMGIN